MKITWAILATLPLAMACTDAASDGAEAIETGEVAGATVEPLTLDSEVPGDAVLVQATGGGNAPFDPDCAIGEDRVAGIRMPATLGAFAASFPAATALAFEPHFMVDFGALCAMQGGEDAICAIFESYEVEQYGPDIEVVGMSVYAPQCQTEEGVGPGTAIETAISAYGAATFGFNYSNESREYVSFENGPANLTFRAEADDGDMPQDPAGPGGRSAGDYSGVQDVNGEFFETGEFRSGARIWEVWISGPSDG